MSEKKHLFKVIHHFPAKLVSNKCVCKSGLMSINGKILGAKNFFLEKVIKKTSRFLGVVMGA